jgi:antitoxin (DNA-binding transcriptional repressor) of toxin-antitoxin stability system
MKASIVDLRYRMKDVLGALDRGEKVVVLYRGKEKATLTPILKPADVRAKGAKFADQPLFGLWSDREDMADPVSYVRKLRASRNAGRGKRK